MDLAARTARSGVGHPPEVVVVALFHVAPGSHPLGWQADLVAPDGARLLVVLVRRGRQSVARYAICLGEQLPRPVDRLALEVVAEAPVAEHLEERVMARGPADLLEVVVLAGHAQAALVVDRPLVAARFAAGQDVLELDHARVAEEQRRSPRRHQAGAGHDGMAPLGKEVEEALTYVGGRQRRDRRADLAEGAFRHALTVAKGRASARAPSFTLGAAGGRA